MWTKVRDWVLGILLAVGGVVVAILGASNFLEQKERERRIKALAKLVNDNSRKRREEEQRALDEQRLSQAESGMARLAEEVNHAVNSSTLGEYLDRHSSSDETGGDR